jgi:hypothetical protein
MALDRELLGTHEKFEEVLEAKIEAGEGVFEEPHPFLRTALRGLTRRLNGEFVPMGLVMATELYVHDINTGKDGFTGEPMPSEVTGMPAGVTGMMVRMTAGIVAEEAFGQEFGDAVKQVYSEIFDQQTNGQ